MKNQYFQELILAIIIYLNLCNTNLLKCPNQVVYIASFSSNYYLTNFKLLITPKPLLVLLSFS